MSPNEEQVQQLRELGLNTYEARTYLTLLGKDSFTPSQVADYSGVPRQRIYDILATLVERGLVISRPGRRGTKYSAVSPQPALHTLLRAEQSRLIKLQHTTTELIERLSHVYDEGQSETSPLDYIEVLRGSASLNQRFADIENNCKRELLVFTKPPYARPPQENTEGIELLKRHIIVRSIYTDSALIDQNDRKSIHYFIQNGEQARFVDELPLKLIIADETTVMFALEDPLVGRSDLTYLAIENPQLAQLLKRAFNALWEQGETFEQTCQRLSLPLPEQNTQEPGVA